MSRPQITMISLLKMLHEIQIYLKEVVAYREYEGVYDHSYITRGFEQKVYSHQEQLWSLDEQARIGIKRAKHQTTVTEARHVLYDSIGEIVARYGVSMFGVVENASRGTVQERDALLQEVNDPRNSGSVETVTM